MITGGRNVALLATSQALALSAVVLSVTLAGILGAVPAPDKGLATLPIAAMVVDTAIASIPASILTRRLGRRAGFLIGAAFGVAGSALAAAGLHTQSFLHRARRRGLLRWAADPGQPPGRRIAGALGAAEESIHHRLVPIEHHGAQRGNRAP